MPYALSVSGFLQPLAGAYPFGRVSTESRRLAAVARVLGEDEVLARAFDPVARLAAQLCDVPVALCTLVGRDSIRLLGNHGFTPVRDLPIEVGLCGTTILRHVPHVIERADQDALAKKNSLVAGPENVRFYVGVPLRVGEQNVGTLCVMDRVARHADPETTELLEHLGQLAADRLERFVICHPERSAAGA